MKFILVPSMVVRVPNGKRKRISAFHVSAAPITAAQYALYSKSKGCKTIEEEGNEFSYFNNPCFENIPVTDMDLIPAFFISFAEAEAFCKSHGGALPSQEQWLAILLHQESRTLKPFTLSSREWVRNSTKLKKVMVGRPLMRGTPLMGSAQDYFRESDSKGDISISFRLVLTQSP